MQGRRERSASRGRRSCLRGGIVAAVRDRRDRTRGTCAGFERRAIAQYPQMLARCVNTPLWPAGHLPLKGGDYSAIDAFAKSPRLPRNGEAKTPLISPLEGEMAGRPEGGAGGPNVDGSLIGTVELGDGRVALGIALPFGHTTANLLKTFAETARDAWRRRYPAGAEADAGGDLQDGGRGRSAAETGGNARFRHLARRSQAGDFGLPRRAGLRVGPYPGETDRR